MLRGIIVDFDGVIIDTEKVWFEIYKEWFRENVQYNLSVEEFLICVGASSDVFFNRMKEEKIEINRLQFEEEAGMLFLSKSAELPIKTGVKRLLEESRELGLQVALATSATLKKPKFHLERLGLMKYFDYLVTAELVENIKPAPDLFICAADKMGCKSEECIVIEDSKNGVIAAHRALMRTILVPNEITEHDTFEEVYLKVNSLEEVEIKEIANKF